MSDRVAIIGAGPSGIVAAKFLLQEGLQPVVFEQSDRAGGQWHVSNSLSGIWPGMPTNTSRIMTQFSDLEHLPGLPAFPSAEQIHDYLQRYMDVFGIHNCLRLATRVVDIERRDNNRWQVTYATESGFSNAEVFDFLLIASGRFNHPCYPAIPGLKNVSGRQSGIGIYHSHDYKGVEEFRNKRVLVAGGAISALEIASDLSIKSDAQVHCAYRKQRYVMRKLARGIPTDHINFSLYEAQAAECLPAEVTASRMRDWLLSEFGNPQDAGAPCPDPDLRKAGTTKCEHFLRLVAEKRIQVRPWLDRVEKQAVNFSDSSQAKFDAILFATGYQLNFPFLRSKEAQILGLTRKELGLYQHTFHPDLPGFAMLGFYNQVGPYFPVLELQARWIAYVWSQRIAAPERARMQHGLQDYLNTWQQPQKLPMHQLALLFARAIGALPEPSDWPSIKRELWFGPLCPVFFRLSGPDVLSDAPQRLTAAARAFGMIPDGLLSGDETRKLKAIAAE